MMEQRSEHPLDIELLSYALNEADTEFSALLDTHLAECLLCRVQLQRIRRHDLNQDDPGVINLQFPEISPVVVDIVAGKNRPDSFAPGQVWFAGNHRKTAIWLAHVDIDNGFAVAYGATLDVAAADHTAVIVRSELLDRDLAIFTSVPGTVPLDQLAFYVETINLGDAVDAVIAASELPVSERQPESLPDGLRVGPPIDGATDPRIEFRQLLADDISALDPETDDETAEVLGALPSDGDESDGFEAIVSRIRFDLQSDLEARRRDLCGVTPLDGPDVGLFAREMRLVPTASVREVTCRMLIFTAELAVELRPKLDEDAAYELLLKTGAECLVISDPQEPYPAEVFVGSLLRPGYDLPLADHKGPTRAVQTKRPLFNAVFDYLEGDAFAIEEGTAAAGERPASPGVVTFLADRSRDAITKLKAIRAQKGKNVALKELSVEQDGIAIQQALVTYESLDDLVDRLEEITGP